MSIKDIPSLPQGWAEATLPELVGAGGLMTDGDWVETENQDPNGEVRLTQLADVGDGIFRDRSNRFMTYKRAIELKCTFLEPGDVMIARMPDPLGRACVFPGSKKPCVTVVDVCVVRPAKTISTRWLTNFVNAPQFRIAVADLQSGSTRKRISKANLSTIPLRVPPREEQSKIAEAVESYFSRLDEAVATLERVQRNLKRYRASVLKAAVEGQLVPTEAALARAEKREYEPASELLERILAERRHRWNRNSKYEEPAAPDTSTLPKLPEGWCWATIEQICATIVDCPHSTPKWTEHGRICVRTTEFSPGRLNLEGVRFVSEETYLERIQRLRPAPGDIIYSREGGILGIACVIPPGVELCLGQRMMLMRPARPVLSRYLMNVLNSPLTLDRVRRLTGGSASPHLNVGEVREFPVPLPPLAEADRIVQAVDDSQSIAESLEESTRANGLRSARLRQSILKWAFEGKLVDQDPNDEPASALLNRIRAERSGTADKKTPARRGRQIARNA